MTIAPAASLLTLPSELRNAIYLYIFEPEAGDLQLAPPVDSPSPLAVALKLDDSNNDNNAAQKPKLASPIRPQLRVLQTCKQIHAEAHLLALALTPVQVYGESTYPDAFAARARRLSAAKLGAIRQVELTARISHLRALNETWAGLPFGSAHMQLDVLVVVPTRPDVCAAAYAEIADLSQSHTLAYVFCETLKRLRRVRCVEVRNRGCFNEVVWRLLYRSLVYRLWRWGGGKCGLRFESGEWCAGGSERPDNQWFRVFMHATERGNEVGDEVVRLVGQTGELPDPNLAGISP